jgi:hypothetical protein
MKNVQRFVLLLLLLLLGSQALPVPKVHAWSGRTPTQYGGLADYNWIEYLKTQYNTDANAADYVMYQPDDSYGTSPSGNMQWVLLIGSKITFTTDSNGLSKFCTNPSTPFSSAYTVYQSTTNGGALAYGINPSPATGYAQSNGSYCVGLTGAGVDRPLYALAFTKATFTSGYTGSPIPLHTLTIPKQSCAALDIACWMGDLGTAIGGTLDNVSKAILAGLTWLFVPDSSTMAANFTRIQALISDKLGLISDSFSVITNLFQPLINANDNGCTTAGCTKSFGTLFGRPFNVDFATVAKTMPSVWSFTTLFLRGAILIAFAFVMRRKIIEIIAR